MTSPTVALISRFKLLSFFTLIGIEPTTCLSQVQRSTRCATAPHKPLFFMIAYYPSTLSHKNVHNTLVHNFARCLPIVPERPYATSVFDFAARLSITSREWLQNS